MKDHHWDTLASHYHDDIVSPFFRSNGKKIIAEIRKLPSAYSVAEFGCGLGYLVDEFKRFKHATMIDFSSEMVKETRKKARGTTITVKKQDITKVTYAHVFDAIISVNALLMPSLVDRQKAFSGIKKALKSKGKLILVLPSMEAVMHHANLLLHDDLAKKGDAKATSSAKKRFELPKYDLFKGIYREGSERQKFYFRHEIEHALKGFTLTFSKLFYEWDETDYQSFPGEEKIWDWLVIGSAH